MRLRFRQLQVFQNNLRQLTRAENLFRIENLDSHELLTFANIQCNLFIKAKSPALLLAFNQAIDAATAEEIAKLFTEVIIAPEASPDAVRILSAKKNLRLLIAAGLPDPNAQGWLKN